MNPVPPDVTLERERLIWKYRTEELLTHMQIAERLNLDRSTVSYALRRIRQRVSTDLLEAAEQYRVEQADSLQMIAAEAIQAWHESKKSEKSVTKKSAGKGVEDDDGHRVVGRNGEVTISNVRDQDGDPRFLAEARAAMADVRKILGVDAPEKRDVTLHGDGNPDNAILSADLSKLTPEQLRALAWEDAGAVHHVDQDEDEDEAAAGLIEPSAAGLWETIEADPSAATDEENGS